MKRFREDGQLSKEEYEESMLSSPAASRQVRHCASVSMASFSLDVLTCSMRRDCAARCLGSTTQGTWRQAPAFTLAQRRIVKPRSQDRRREFMERVHALNQKFQLFVAEQVRSRAA